MTFEEFAAKHGVTLTHKTRETKRTGFGYWVTLNYAGKALTAKFFKGAAHVGTPITSLDREYNNGEWRLSRKIVGYKQLNEKERKEFLRYKKDRTSVLPGYRRVAMEAVPIPPQLDEVLYCLALDSQSFMNAPTWKQFAGEFGYNVDSIKEKKTFKACRNMAAKLQNLFGWVTFQEFIHCTEE